MKILKFLVALGVIGIVALVVFEWAAANRGAAVLKQTIAAQDKILGSANADKNKNASDLQKALAQIELLKRQVKTPAQAVRGLNQVLPLAQPIIFEPDEGPAENSLNLKAQGDDPRSGKIHNDSSERTTAMPQGADLHHSQNVSAIPAADLVPLYDYAQDCRACAVRLESARRDALDNATAIRALEAERDAAVKASRGGNFAHRLKVAAIWFSVGAGTGLVLASTASQHHRDNLLRAENPYYVLFG